MECVSGPSPALPLGFEMEAWPASAEGPFFGWRPKSLVGASQAVSLPKRDAGSRRMTANLGAGVANLSVVTSEPADTLGGAGLCESMK